MRIRILILITVIALTAVPANLRADELYKTMLVRAAPGKLLELIELSKRRMSFYKEAGEKPPFWMRHSQGDQWDLLFLFPIGSFTEHYTLERVEKRHKAQKATGVTSEEYEKKWFELVAWHEEIFVNGPDLDVVARAFKGAGFFHVEMFRALPGLQDELYKQREMENVYLETLDRPQNLIFTHSQGAAWDLFTIGAYRDLKHFAESADIPEDREEAAARKAGFKSASDIGPYLRTLIAQHNDTLAVAIR